jgi:hypothetical protein
VTRTGYGLIAGILGAGLTAWWWRRNRALSSFAAGKGSVIFDNTPRASSPDGNI